MLEREGLSIEVRLEEVELLAAILDEYYAGRDNHHTAAVDLEIGILCSSLMRTLRPTSAEFLILDRSYASMKWFLPTMTSAGKLSQSTSGWLDTLVDVLTILAPPQGRHYRILLDAPSEEVRKRITERGRRGEEAFWTLPRIQSIRRSHTKDMEHFFAYIDAAQEIDQVVEDLAALLRRIIAYELKDPACRDDFLECRGGTQPALQNVGQWRERL